MPVVASRRPFGRCPSLLAFFAELEVWDEGIRWNEHGFPVFHLGPDPDADTEERAIEHNWWIRGSCECHAIADAGRPVGFAVVIPDPSLTPYAMDADVELHDFWIDPSARRTGLGRDAVSLVIATHPGVRWRISTLAENVVAHAFWRTVLPAPVEEGIDEQDGGPVFFTTPIG